MSNNPQQKPIVASTQNENIDAETLYSVTHNVAKDVLGMRKERTTQTKKMLVIGQAMIEQKQVLGNIIATQKDNNNVMQKKFSETLQTQNSILKTLDTTNGNIDTIQKSCGVQNEMIHSLQTLKDRHAKVMLDSQQIKHQQIQRMGNLKKDLDAFQQMLNSADIEGKCVQIKTVMGSIMSTLEQYRDARNQQRNILKQYIDTTTTLLSQFQKDIKEQRSIVAHINKEAMGTNDIAISIDKKLSMLLSHQEKKMTTTLPTLEEAFGGINKPKEEPVQESVQESVQEQEPVQEPAKKKSVLKSLFGGK